jgi:hypothetical protein
MGALRGIAALSAQSLLSSSGEQSLPVPGDRLSGGFCPAGGHDVLGIGILFYDKPRTYLPMGLVDLAFGITEAILLGLAVKNEKWA